MKHLPGLFLRWRWHDWEWRAGRFNLYYCCRICRVYVCDEDPYKKIGRIRWVSDFEDIPEQRRNRHWRRGRLDRHPIANLLRWIVE